MAASELREWMDANAYSNQTLADALGVSRRTVIRWTTGTREIPTAVSLALKTLKPIKKRRPKQ